MNHERLYRYRFRSVDQAARAAVWGEVAPFVHELLGRPERVLDPAAGRGEFLNAVPAGERWAYDLVQYPEGVLDPQIRATVCDIFDADIPPAYFDAIWVSNFLEHMHSQDAVAAFLEKMHVHLAPGGRIAVMGPNFRYAKNQYFDMADHTVALTHRAVAEHLYAAGFEPTVVIDRFLPYSFTGRMPASPLLTRAYLRLPLAWKLLGKQFLVIAEREAA